MKIAIYHNLPHGGAKRATYEWVKRLCKNHHVDLFVIDDIAEEFLSMKEIVRKFDIFSKKTISSSGQFTRFISLAKIWFYSIKIAKSINKGEYDIALVFQCHVTNAPPVLKYLKIPSLFICHEPLARMFEPHYKNQSKNIFFSILRTVAIKIFIALEKMNSSYATRICTSSLYSIETLYKYFGKYPKLLYPGVDPEYFKPGKEKRQNAILSVGHLSSSKGHEFIIKSIGCIKGKKPKLIIVHKLEHHRYNYRKILQNIAIENNVEVEFYSSLSDKELSKLYHQCKITLCGYHLEPLGLIALESLASGTPVISVAEAGLRETVIHKKTGLLIERDEEIFGYAIAGLLKNTQLRKRMAFQGRQEILKHWNWGQSHQKLEVILNKTTQVFSLGESKI